jgi:hypothetical protein
MKKQSAVTMVEAVIVVPLALAIVFGLVYFALVSVIQGVAESAAHRALDLAITLPELEVIPVPPPVCPPQSSNCASIHISAPSSTQSDSYTNFCQGICKVKEEALALPNNSFFKHSSKDSFFAYFSDDIPAVTINIENKSFSENQSSTQAYNENPIIIQLNYKLKPLVPFGSERTKTAVASGFRESQSSFSYPIKVDCLGEPYDAPVHNNKKCQCMDGETTSDDNSGAAWEYYGEHPAWGYYKDQHDVERCRRCPYPSIPYYGDKNFDFYAATNNWPDNYTKTGTWDGPLVQDLCSQIPGKPQGYTCPVDGCWCPSQQTCVDKMGLGAAVFNAPWWQCGCDCSWNYQGFQQKADQCTCDQRKDIFGSQTDVGDSDVNNGYNITFTDHNAVDGNFCTCLVAAVNGVALPSPTRLTKEMCENLYPGAIGHISPDITGCHCICSSGCGVGAFDSTDGSIRGGNSFWKPTNCGCTCYNPSMQITDGKCACTQTTPTAQLCGSKILANARIDPSDCTCQCDPAKCINGNWSQSGDCSCLCGSNGHPPDPVTHSCGDMQNVDE